MTSLIHPRGTRVEVPDAAADVYLKNGWTEAGKAPAKATKKEADVDASDADTAAPVPSKPQRRSAK